MAVRPIDRMAIFKLPRINLALVIFCIVMFALPFATVSCSGSTLAQATGYQLALGSSADNVLTAVGHQIVSTTTGIQLSGRKPPLWSATLALLFILVAGAVSFAGRSAGRGTGWSAGICFALSVLALIYLQSDLQRTWQNSAYALTPFVLVMQPAYWVVVTLASLGALVNIYAAISASPASAAT